MRLFRLAPNHAKKLESFGSGELFAGEARDKPPFPNSLRALPFFGARAAGRARAGKEFPNEQVAQRTPQRSSNWRAKCSMRSSGERLRRREAAMPSARRRAWAAFCGAPLSRRRFGSISARRLSNPSAVTKPPASSSHRPSSTSLARRCVCARGQSRSSRPVFQASGTSSAASERWRKSVRRSRSSANRHLRAATT